MAAAAPQLEVPVGRVLCPVDGRRQCERFDIHTVPRLALVSAAQSVFWHYDRPVATATEEDLQLFVKERHQSLVAVPLPPPPPPQGTSYVEVLGDANISVAEGSEDTWMIDFFHPQCGYCRGLEPIFAALSVEVREDPDVKLAAVDVQHNQLAMKRYRVVAYPMIIVLREGKFYVYNGDRTVERLKEFLYNPTSVPPRPVPKPNFGPIDLLQMFYEEVVDTLEHIWQTPEVRDQVLLVLFVGIPVLAAASGVLIYCLLRCMGELGPSATVNDAKKND
eukprot:EG_transcript_16927